MGRYIEIIAKYRIGYTDIGVFNTSFMISIVQLKYQSFFDNVAYFFWPIKQLKLVCISARPISSI